MDARCFVLFFCSLLCVGQQEFIHGNPSVLNRGNILLRNFRRFRDALPQQTAQNDKCGIANTGASRVVLGEDASLGEWPWQVAMYLKQASNQDAPRFFCGGSLIDVDWVVTAAHCILDNDESKYRIVIGGIDSKKIEKSEQVFRVKRIIKHPLYQTPSTLNNDIALLQLSRKAMITPFVNTICLPRSGEKVTVGTKCFISGWGKMFHPGDAAEFLQQAAMPIVSNQACEAKLETSPKDANYSNLHVTNKMVCAGDAGKTKTSGCHGDSGGPFVCKGQHSNRWVLQGVVSWGDPHCSSSNHYSVFTRVSQFTDWIYKQMEKFTFRM